MQIEFTPADLLPAISQAYRVVTDGDDIGLEIETKNDGLVTFWFRTASDLQSFVNRINIAVKGSTVHQGDSLAPSP